MKRIYIDLDLMSRKSKLALADDSGTPRDVLSMLSELNDNLINEALCKNPNTDFKVLEEFSKSNSFNVLVALVNNPVIPTRFFGAISQSTHPAVLEALCSCERTPGSILFELARKKIRLELIAGNKSAFTDLLDYVYLVGHDNVCVLEKLAGNPNTSFQTLKDIWEFYPYNIKCREDVYVELIRNEKFVKNYFGGKLKEIKPFDAENVSVDDILLESAKLLTMDTKKTCFFITYEGDLDVGSTAVRRCSDGDLLDVLSHDYRFLEDVAGNPYTSFKTLRKMAKRHKELVLKESKLSFCQKLIIKFGL